MTRGTTMAVVAAVMLMTATGCGEDAAETTTTTSRPADLIVLDYEFINGSDGWASEVADYTEATRPEDVLSQTGEAPSGLDPSQGFFHLAASNPSDDLFLYMLREVTDADGLVAGATYEVSYEVEFASNAPSGCAGIGGAPGESVWMKVGASAEQPVPVQRNGDIRLAVDKGGQSQGGEDAEVAGVIANGIPCEEALEQDPTPYAMVTLEESLAEPVTADDDGSLWLFVGTDSGFEGRTSIYYDRVVVTLRRTP